VLAIIGRANATVTVRFCRALALSRGAGPFSTDRRAALLTACHMPCHRLVCPRRAKEGCQHSAPSLPQYARNQAGATPNGLGARGSPSAAYARLKHEQWESSTGACVPWLSTSGPDDFPWQSCHSPSYSPAPAKQTHLGGCISLSCSNRRHLPADSPSPFRAFMPRPCRNWTSIVPSSNAGLVWGFREQNI
jgi:hypothetical protein